MWIYPNNKILNKEMETIRQMKKPIEHYYTCFDPLQSGQ